MENSRSSLSLNKAESEGVSPRAGSVVGSGRRAELTLLVRWSLNSATYLWEIKFLRMDLEPMRFECSASRQRSTGEHETVSLPERSRASSSLPAPPIPVQWSRISPLRFACRLHFSCSPEQEGMVARRLSSSTSWRSLTPGAALERRRQDKRGGMASEASMSACGGAVEGTSFEECPICLEKVKERRAFLHACDHVFCFDCLVTWVKIKAICPMCKNQLTSIICFESNSLQEISIRPRQRRKFPFVFRLARLFDRHLRLCWASILTIYILQVLIFIPPCHDQNLAFGMVRSLEFGHGQWKRQTFWESNSVKS